MPFGNSNSNFRNIFVQLICRGKDNIKRKLTTETDTRTVLDFRILFSLTSDGVDDAEEEESQLGEEDASDVLVPGLPLLDENLVLLPRHFVQRAYSPFPQNQTPGQSKRLAHTACFYGAAFYSRLIFMATVGMFAAEKYIDSVSV